MGISVRASCQENYVNARDRRLSRSVSNPDYCLFKPQIFTLTNLSGVKPRQDLGQNGVEDMIQLT